jgi:hypothetical protein
LFGLCNAPSPISRVSFLFEIAALKKIFAIHEVVV